VEALLKDHILSATLIFVSTVVQHLAPGDAPCIDASLSPFSAVRSACFFVQAQPRKKDITGQATINGIRASTRSSKEMTAKALAAA
jgi:hypothetical protein